MLVIKGGIQSRVEEKKKTGGTSRQKTPATSKYNNAVRNEFHIIHFHRSPAHVTDSHLNTQRSFIPVRGEGGKTSE